MSTATVGDYIITSEVMQGRHGPIPVRHYQPRGAETLSRLVWLHGGSFLGGDLDMLEADQVGRALATYGIAVTSVEYPLAPVPPEFEVAAGGLRAGVHYPIAVDEIETVFLRLQDRTRSSWALGGASAGGALAASTAVRLRAASKTSPSSLVLVYPLLHRVLPAPSPSLASQLAGAVLEPTPQEVTVMNENYLGAGRTPDEVRGAFVGDGPVDDFPPALIVDSEVDLLRASSQHFAAALIAAGNEVHYRVEPHTRHGHLNVPGAAATHTLRTIAGWLLARGPVTETNEEALK